MQHKTMHEHDQSHYREAALQAQLSQTATSSGFTAVLMLLVGYFVYDSVVALGDSRLFAASVTAFTWTLKAGGFLLLLAAALCYIGWPAALRLDAVLTAAIGAAFLIESAIWLWARSLEGVVVLVFGIALLYSARQSWRAGRRLAAMSAAAPDANAATGDVGGETTGDERPKDETPG